MNILYECNPASQNFNVDDDKNFSNGIIFSMFRERYKRKDWLLEIPADYKLKDAEITRFVKSMQPVVSVSMFSKYGSHDSAIALRHLANMRPELIIPDLLEKYEVFYNTFFSIMYM